MKRLKKIILLGLFGLLGCTTSVEAPTQGKRVWVMSDTDNINFALKESNGTLFMLHTCTRVPMWKGMHADIIVQWDPENVCYIVDYVRDLEGLPK